MNKGWDILYQKQILGRLEINIKLILVEKFKII